MSNVELPKSVLTRSQLKTYRKMVHGYGERGEVPIRVEVRYDDECGNGHNTFSITGSIGSSVRNPIMAGCIHEEIEKHFPELAHLIKWHLMSSDGPMHYIANTLYLASDKDAWGRCASEVSSTEKRLYFDGFPIQQKVARKFIKYLETHPKITLNTEIIEIAHEQKEKDTYKFAPKYTINPSTSVWHECEFDSVQEAEEMILALVNNNYEIREVATDWSMGKEPELEAARHCAIAPNATLEQLQSKEWLIKRLPALIEEFKRDMESLGFVY